ncbi:MAG: HD domain-containing protein [Deltaproteobacteria bacterium]|nr:HD domain-containing protein [Deltaproteobacteria bacterium]NIS77874.1 HD domain-containing protein [Deltaproteobacteria bacterium]
MGKSLFIRDLKNMESALIFSDNFLVTSKSLLKTNAGKPYLSITLKDATGEIDGRVWDNVEEISSRFGSNDYVQVSGSLVTHQGKHQVKILNLTRVEAEEVDPGDFLASTTKSIDEMWQGLSGLIESLADESLKAFLKEFFSSSDIAVRVKTAPAGKILHHEFIGGLLEHILSVATICDFLSSHYPGVNRDMLLAGAILHDIGKIHELSYDKAIDYTDEGKLIGHIVMGAEMVSKVEERKKILGEEKEMLLKHIILSHHGELEYGSPKRPKTLEALIVHFVENLDSKVSSFLSVIEKSEGDETWSDYQRMFNRFLYVKRDEE